MGSKHKQDVTSRLLNVVPGIHAKNGDASDSHAPKVYVDRHKVAKSAKKPAGESLPRYHSCSHSRKSFAFVDFRGHGLYNNITQWSGTYGYYENITV